MTRGKHGQRELSSGGSDSDGGASDCSRETFLRWAAEASEGITPPHEREGFRASAYQQANQWWPQQETETRD